MKTVREIDERALKRERTRSLGEIHCEHRVPRELEFGQAESEARAKLLTEAAQRGADLIIFGEAIVMPHNGTRSVLLSAEIYAHDGEW